MNLTEAREVVEKLKHPGSIIFIDDPRQADEYIGRCKGFLEGHKAALESKVVSELRYAVERALTLKPDMPNKEWFDSVIEDFDKLLEAQK